MPFNLIQNLSGLFNFFRKYGTPNLEQAIQIFNGFFTGTPGAYNPVYNTPKWRNTKEKPYKTEEFEIIETLPLNIISTKFGHKKFKLGVKQDFNFIKKNSINVLYDFTLNGKTKINVIKLLIPIQKLKKIQILLKSIGIYTQSININTNLYTRSYTPINVKTWIKKNLVSKLGVFGFISSTDKVRISDSTYIIDDVGNISDIEMIQMIGDINAIRH